MSERYPAESEITSDENVLKAMKVIGGLCIAGGIYTIAKGYFAGAALVAIGIPLLTAPEGSGSPSDGLVNVEPVEQTPPME